MFHRIPIHHEITAEVLSKIEAILLPHHWTDQEDGLHGTDHLRRAAYFGAQLTLSHLNRAERYVSRHSREPRYGDLESIMATVKSEPEACFVKAYIEADDKEAFYRGFLRAVLVGVYLHDCVNEDMGGGLYAEHGKAGVTKAREIIRRHFPDLVDEQDVLFAIYDHSKGWRATDDDVRQAVNVGDIGMRLLLIGTIWDADRLDYSRLGQVPNAEYMSTARAQEPGIISWAIQQSYTMQGIK